MAGLKSSYEEYIALSRYARWLPEEKRREGWDETTQRWGDFWVGKFPKHKKIVRECQQSIYDTDVMGSMRTMMTAGEALDRDNVAGFNCSYVAVDHPRVFDETMYILMCGTGLGFSVEAKSVSKLPTIAEEFYDTDTTILVRDSKIGWAKAFKELIAFLYQGQVPKWDVSKVRAEGEPLKTFGGRASGPQPLVDLFQYTVNTFRRFAGNKLTPIAAHDIMCKIAEIVVVGGVRRSALISLSDLSDAETRVAKSQVKVVEYTLLGHTEDETKRKYSVVVDDKPYGERSLLLELDDWESEQLQRDHEVNWYHVHPERALANNSVCYTEKPDIGIFIDEWKALYDSKSGERGIFNREAANNLLPARRAELGYTEWGCNPCSEIVLRSKQFCNLSEVVIRKDDTLDTLKEKVRKAAIIGTMQATLTDFRYLSSAWKKNTEEEALLGVSLTGIMDHPVMSGTALWEDTKVFVGKEYSSELTDEDMLDGILRQLKEVAIETNKEWAKKLGINPATAITAVKPSGTVSQLVDSSSGIHPRYSDYYIRTVRADKKDPLATMMVAQGFPVEDDVMKPDSGYVFSFPIKSPEGSVMRDDMTAIEQCEMWKTYQLHWTEHKPSITVYVKEDEWLQVGSWVYDNFDIVSGISFLPHSDHSYKQAPYQEIDKDEYERMVGSMPTADWSLLGEYELVDATTGMKEYSCSGNACELTI